MEALEAKQALQLQHVAGGVAAKLALLT